MSTIEAGSSDSSAHDTIRKRTCKVSTTDECSICLQPISERCVAFPCNHLSFDFICLASWLQEHTTCPLCKAQVTKVEYDWRGPNDFQTFEVPQNSESESSSPSGASAYDGTRGRALRRPGTRRLRPQPQIYSAPLTPSAIARRRFVYDNDLYSLRVGSNRLSRYQDFAASDFANSSTMKTKARAWIRRELQVFDFLRDGATRPAGASRRVNNVEFVLDYTMSVLASVDIKSSSGAAQTLLGDLIGEANANRFLHELNEWLRSPFTQLENWDRHVQYDRPLPFTRDEIITDPMSIPWGGLRRSNACSNGSRA